MFNKKFGKDVVMVLISNGVRMLSSILSVFIVPILFTQKDYGFYNLFILYVSYVGLFHFGFIDGIYLKYGGKEYEDLSKDKFKTYSKFMIILQTLMMIIVSGIALFSSGDRQLILFAVAANMFALNMTSYYQFISQCTGRFKEFAFRNIIHTILTITLISVFYFFKIDSYLLFIGAIISINMLLVFWYMFTYRDITFGKSVKLKDESKEIKYLFSLGIPLLISNLIATLISNLPKQFIEWRYPVEEYPEVFSTFSFAFTLLGFASVFLSAVGLVIYPVIKKSKKDDLAKVYNKLNTFIIVVMFIALTAYYPAGWIIERFIPKYYDSIKIFFILCPGLVLTSANSVIKHNYYKSLNANKEFLVIGFFTIVIMIGSIFGSYFLISKNIHIVAIATVIVQFIWFLLLDFYLARKMKVSTVKNTIYVLIMSVLFYGMGLMDANRWIIMILYLLLTLMFCYVYFSKEIKNLFRIVIKKR